MLRSLTYLVLVLALMSNVPVFSQTKKEQAKLEKQAKKEQARLEKERKKEEKKRKKKELPENIEAFPKNFLIRPRFVYPEVSLNVSNRMFGKGEKFKYKPAMPGVVGLSIKIKKVYVSAAIQLPASEQLKKKYGETKFRNININIQGRTVLWSIFYRDYKGFYLKDYENYYPNWNKDSLGYPKSPGLRIIEGGLNMGFNFNKNFSMNAAFAQGERQKKGAGSFLMGWSERWQYIEADTSFVPPTQGDLYPNLNKLKFGNFISTIIYVGYGYQFVIKKVHFTPVLLAGTGFQIQIYEQTDKKRFWINMPTYATLKGQLGYNGDHFFANLVYVTEFNSIPIKESRIRLYHNWLEFGMGLRF
ncbi:MAG: hypothetical protein C0448_02510 [Sphingobacteriaceae bacterium]|nr:hypothetical protein [Sphingobacteriaceae bacterium]